MSKATAPQGWSYAAIGELCTLINGRAFKPSEWTDTGLPIIRIQNLNNPDAKFNYFLGDVAPKFIVENGELLFAWSGTPGTSFGAHIWNGGRAILNQHIFRVLFNETVINKAFFQIAINQKLQELIDKAHGGVGLRHVTKGKFEHTEILLPPLNEQRRIVAKIEALKARSQQVKEALEAIPPLLEQFRQSVLAAAFRGDLTDVWREKNPDVIPVKELLKRSDQENPIVLPFTWNLASVGDVTLSLKYGTSQKCSYDTEGVPVLRIPNVSNGSIDRSDLKFARLPVKEFEELKLIPGDILIIRSNGSVSLVGKSAIVGESEKDFAYAGYLIRLRPNKFLIDSNYLNLCFSSYNFRLQIEIPARSTSGVHNINSQEVKQLKISLPRIEEQSEIFYRVQSLFKAADQVEQQYQQARADLEQLDQSILAKAFQGELVPQDPNDEPASVLLERIHAERAKREAEAKAAKKSTGKTNGRRSRKAQQQDSESIQLGLPGVE